MKNIKAFSNVSAVAEPAVKAISGDLTGNDVAKCGVKIAVSSYAIPTATVVLAGTILGAIASPIAIGVGLSLGLSSLIDKIFD